MEKSFRGVNGVRFSVIIPVYNAEKYIEESVNSVLNQSYKDFEIVLVDDGSTDESGSICDCLQKKHESIIKVTHQENKGQLLSRCAGAKEAQGDYCVYLDADDIIYENCLEILSKAIDRFSNVDVIGYKIDRLSRSGEKICRHIPLVCDMIYSNESKKLVYEKLMSTVSLNSMCNKCIKRECLLGCEEKFLEYKALRYSEDRLQVLESLTKAQTIVFIDESLYCYRLFDSSVTRNFDISQVDKFNIKLLCEAEEKYLQKWGMKSPEWQKKVESFFLNNATYTFLKFYENVKDTKQRSQLIKYNWLDFVPESYVSDLPQNPNVSDFNKQLWGYIINQEYLKMKIFLTQHIAYKKIRNVKRKIIK